MPSMSAGSRRSLNSPEVLENYLRAADPPRWSLRLSEIDRGVARTRHKLAVAYEQLAREYPDDEDAFAAAWMERLAGWHFDAGLNELIGQHNDWFPIERQLPIDIRTRDYRLINGRSYRRPVLDADWAAGEFPPRRRSPAAACDVSRARRGFAGAAPAPSSSRTRRSGNDCGRLGRRSGPSDASPHRPGKPVTAGRSSNVNIRFPESLLESISEGGTSLAAQTRESEPGDTAKDGDTPVVALRGISRRFGGVHALRGVDLELHAGEVLGLLGENGAGKSTLVKILTGVISPDEGQVLVDGEEHRFHNSREAHALGITATYQEPMMFPTLDVAENIFAGRHPTARGVVRWRDLYEEAEATLDELGVEVDVRTPVYQLGIADRQLIEIAKSLSTGARVLVLDEPTAVLSSREIDRLFEIVRTLRSRGVAMMFISHKLDEIREITDRVVVMRDGARVAERSSKEVAVSELIRLMVGREIADLYPARPSSPGDVMLEVTGLGRDGYFDDITFAVRRGEIVGFAGLVGAGRTELAQSLFGIDPIDRGEIRLDGLRFVPQSPRHAVKRGVAYLPENRLVNGLVPTMRVPLNIDDVDLARAGQPARGVAGPAR